MFVNCYYFFNFKNINILYCYFYVFVLYLMQLSLWGLRKQSLLVSHFIFSLWASFVSSDHFVPVFIISFFLTDFSFVTLCLNYVLCYPSFLQIFLQFSISFSWSLPYKYQDLAPKSVWLVVICPKNLFSSCWEVYFSCLLLSLHLSSVLFDPNDFCLLYYRHSPLSCLLSTFPLYMNFPVSL